MPALRHWLYLQALQTLRVLDVIVQPPLREHWYFKQSRSFTLRRKKPCINADAYRPQNTKYAGNTYILNNNLQLKHFLGMNFWKLGHDIADKVRASCNDIRTFT